jgi:hypothetical protein
MPVYVYEHWSSGNLEEPFYVGKTNNLKYRFKVHMEGVKEHGLPNHKCANPRYCNKVRKIWKDNFQVWWVIKEICDSDDEAQEKERFWISFWRTHAPGRLTNIRDGGGPTTEDVLRLTTDESWRRKVKEGSQKRSQNAEWLKNTREASRRKSNSVEYKAKIKDTCKSPEYLEKWRIGMEKYLLNPKNGDTPEHLERCRRGMEKYLATIK